MMRWFVLALVAALLRGQPTSNTLIPSAPPGGAGGACTSTTVAYLSAGSIYTCVGGVWTAGSGGGAGLFFAGDWSSTTAYAIQNVVNYGGSSYVSVATSTGVAPGTDSTKWAILAQQGQTGPPGSDGAPGSPGFSANGRITGGGVFWTGSLTFEVSAASYVIAGTNYTSAQGSVTLAAADPSNPRVDVIGLDSTGAIFKITGTPAPTPVAGTVDPATQLALQSITVSAGATTPSNIATTLMYDENAGNPTEWDATKSGTGLNLASTNNPCHGTIDIEGTALATGNFVQLQKGSGTVDLSTMNILVLYLRSKGAWNSKRTLNIAWLNSGTQVGQAIPFKEGSFGFASADTSTCQQIVIPVAQWQTAAQAVNQLKFTVGGSGGAPGFYLDYIQLQSGLTQQPSTPGMVWRGAWQSTTSYNVNDVVTNANATWVALTASTNSMPRNGTTWALVTQGPSALTLGTRPTGTTAVSKVENQSVANGATQTLLNYTGGQPGYVSAIWLGITSTTRYNERLKIYIDGEGTASIDVRLMAFFGVDYLDNTNNSSGNFDHQFFGGQQNQSNNVGYYSHIQIPFNTGIKIDFVNDTGTATLWSDISYQTGVDNNFNRLKHLWVSENVVTGQSVNAVVTLVNATSLNPGQLFGVFIHYDPVPGAVSVKTAPMEGNVKMYIDGAGSPSYEWSSFEDYFQRSNYFEGIPVTTGAAVVYCPSWVCANLVNVTVSGVGAFRLHIPDQITFENALKVTWNVGDSTQVNFTGTVRVAYTVWYYTN